MDCMHHSGYGHHAGHGFTGDPHSQEGCCCSSGHGQRHFYSKDEMLEHLQEYLKQLQAEVKGVEEHIAELAKE